MGSNSRPPKRPHEKAERLAPYALIGRVEKLAYDMEPDNCKVGGSALSLVVQGCTAMRLAHSATYSSAFWPPTPRHPKAKYAQALALASLARGRLGPDVPSDARLLAQGAYERIARGLQMLLDLHSR